MKAWCMLEQREKGIRKAASIESSLLACSELPLDLIVEFLCNMLQTFYIIVFFLTT